MCRLDFETNFDAKFVYLSNLGFAIADEVNLLDYKFVDE